MLPGVASHTLRQQMGDGYSVVIVVISTIKVLNRLSTVGYRAEGFKIPILLCSLVIIQKSADSC